MRRLWAVFLGVSLWPLGVGASLCINEVSFDSTAGTPDWVELYNAGTAPVVLDGYVLDDGDTAPGRQIFLGGGTTLPPGAYAIVYVDAAGPSDRDFSDGWGTIYSGTSTTVSLAATEDQVALYARSPLSSATLVDFVSWVTDGDYQGASDRTQVGAAAAGLWPSEGVVELAVSMKGRSVGRRRNGGGHRPEDFQAFFRPTPGASNEPPPSPFEASFSVDPARRSFSPFDADPDFRWTRFFFNGSPDDIKTLRVLDVRGRRVRTLLENNRGEDGTDFSGLSTGSVVWDGRDDGNTVVALGVYTALFEWVSSATGQTARSRAGVAVGRPR